MTENEINKFEKIYAQLESLHQEIGVLSKKSGADALNSFKLRLVNKTISEANGVLGANYKPYDDFNQFSDEDLPSNSDVTLIIGQYINCLEKLRADNVEMALGRWYWLSQGERTSIKTSAPRKIENK